MITVEPRLYQGDIDKQVLERARGLGEVGWDIETTGLDWRTDLIETCQISVGGEIAIVQVSEWRVPTLLASLLADSAVRKVFHHAPFDLRFMSHRWKAQASNVACTKIAAKILEPGRDASDYSLQPVLERHLGVVIDKGQQRSDWSRASLTPDQLAYAAADVEHLGRLYSELMSRAANAGVADLVSASFEYLPVRVQLDLSGVGDVFAY